jgi:hypothetical protein
VTEQIEGVSLPEILRYLELARDQIVAWHRADTLPYATDSLAPLSAAWWGQVRRLMRWRVLLDPTRVIDCHCAEQEIERLYEFWVRPSTGDIDFPSVRELREPAEAAIPMPASTSAQG